MATLFYEASTRTDMSFQAAMQRLGGEVIATSGGVQFSSVYKGENLADTVRAVGATRTSSCCATPRCAPPTRPPARSTSWPRAWARTPSSSAAATASASIPRRPCSTSSPSSTSSSEPDGLTVTLVGDLVNGRTVHSLAKLLALYGARDLRLELVSPAILRAPASVIEFARSRGVEVNEHESLDEVIGRSDVIYWTRVQQERFTDPDEYEAIASRFVMTPQVLAAAPDDAILMHPLPRKHEMGTEADHAVLDDDPRSVYFHQMQNGMYVRMALLAAVLGAAG